MLTHHDHQWWAWCVKTSMTSLGVWYDISQKESLEWQSRGAFPALAVKSAAATQIETFASHIGDIYRSLFVTKTVAFVSHQNVCVTACACHNICGSHYVGGPWWPTNLLLPTHAAEVWGLWEAEVCVRQGCRGWWGGWTYLAKGYFQVVLQTLKYSLSRSTNLVLGYFHVFLEIL